MSRHRMPERCRPLVVAAPEKKKNMGEERNGGKRQEKKYKMSNPILIKFNLPLPSPAVGTVAAEQHSTGLSLRNFDVFPAGVQNVWQR